MRTLIWAIIIASGVSVGMTGCAGEGAHAPVQFATHPVSDAGDAALISGTLQERAGCIYLKAGDRLVLPVFPEDVRYEDGSLRFGDLRLALGSEASFSGGLSPSAHGASIPEACSRTQELWFAYTAE